MTAKLAAVLDTAAVPEDQLLLHEHPGVMGPVILVAAVIMVNKPICFKQMQH
jgi:hypothetical protein